ncbi:hypothetical protein NKJ66_27150 [Mesorhizobium sp. M0078]|uniref:hypothetical protein n=1 Tax=Mesorhizobium sp. M0078 TaxID=2956871 RepID=UPI0033362B71
MRSLALLLRVSACISLLSSVAANAGSGITIQYSAKPAVDAVQIGVNRDFGSEPISTDISEDLKTSDVSSGDIASQPSAVFIKWKDNTISSFPLFLVAAFENQKVEIDFSHVAVNEGNVAGVVGAACTSSYPASTEQAFQIMSSCGAATRWMRNTGRQFSDLAMRSLNSWLIANRFLYVKKTGQIQFSPYGLEPDLIDALKEMADKMDENRPRSKEFSPLTRSAIEKTLKDHDEEAVRMAAFVPALVKDKRLQEAFWANQIALDAYQKISGGDPSKVVVSVTNGVLNDNAKYIDTLAAQYKVNIDK